MNHKQRIVAIAGAAAAALMGLFPPWIVTWGSAGGVKAPSVCAFLFSSPESLQAKLLAPIGAKVAGVSQMMAASYGIQLDFTRLAVQWAVLAAIVWGAWLWVGRDGKIGK